MSPSSSRLFLHLCITLVGFSFGELLVVFAPMVKIIFGSKFSDYSHGLARGSSQIGSAILAALTIVLVLVAKKLQKTIN